MTPERESCNTLGYMGAYHVHVKEDSYKERKRTLCFVFSSTDTTSRWYKRHYAMTTLRTETTIGSSPGVSRKSFRFLIRFSSFL